MAISDWTIPTDEVLTQNHTDIPSGGADPVANLHQTNGSAVYRMLYLTSGTLNGVDTRGINSGELEVYHKFTVGFSSVEMGIFFRATTVASNGLSRTCYEIILTKTSTTAWVVTAYRTTNGARHSLTSGNITAPNATDWIKMRVQWSESGGNLTITVDLDVFDGSGYQNKISVTDSNNQGHSSTNQVGITLQHDGSHDLRTENFTVYS